MNPVFDDDHSVFLVSVYSYHGMQFAVRYRYGCP